MVLLLAVLLATAVDVVCTCVYVPKLNGWIDRTRPNAYRSFPTNNL